MDLTQVAVAGAIGILGTIIGTLASHWLTLRRDHIAREEERKNELRRQIVDGSFAVAEKHARTQIPFSRGGALYYPNSRKIDQDKLTQELHELLNLAQKTAKTTDAIYLVESFFQQLQNYLEKDRQEEIVDDESTTGE